MGVYFEGQDANLSSKGPGVSWVKGDDGHCCSRWFTLLTIRLGTGGDLTKGFPYGWLQEERKDLPSTRHQTVMSGVRRGWDTGSYVVLHYSHSLKTFITFTFSQFADDLIQRDLQKVQGHSAEASRVKCLAQGHNVKMPNREMNRQPSD